MASQLKALARSYWRWTTGGKWRWVPTAVMVLIFILILVPSSNGKKDETPAKTSEPAIVQAPTVAPAPAQPSVAPLPTTVPTPALSASQLLLIDYLNRVRPLYDDYTVQYTNGINVTQSGRSAAAMLPDFSSAVTKVKEAGDRLRGLTAPPCLIDTQGSLVKATIQIDDAFARALSGLKNQDSDLILSGATRLNDAKAEFVKFNNLIKVADVKTC